MPVLLFDTRNKYSARISQKNHITAIDNQLIVWYNQIKVKNRRQNVKERKLFPGTTIATDTVNRKTAEEVFSHIFAGGNISSSQVTAIIGIEAHSVQNWVARGFVSHPLNRQYSKRQLCRLIIISMLSNTFKIGDITYMLSTVNGDLSDEGDDLIADDVLYACFCEMCAQNGGQCESERINKTAFSVTEQLNGLGDGDRKKVSAVLKTMFYAYRSAEMNRIAHTMLNSLKEDNNTKDN